MTVTEAAKKSNKPETYKRIIYSVSLGREGDPNCCEQELTTRSRGIVKPESQVTILESQKKKEAQSIYRNKSQGDIFTGSCLKKDLLELNFVGLMLTGLQKFNTLIKKYGAKYRFIVGGILIIYKTFIKYDISWHSNFLFRELK